MMILFKVLLHKIYLILDRVKTVLKISDVTIKFASNESGLGAYEDFKTVLRTSRRLLSSYFPLHPLPTPRYVGTR